MTVRCHPGMQTAKVLVRQEPATNESQQAPDKQQATYYRVACSRELPVVSCTKTLKSELFGDKSRALRNYNLWAYRSRYVLRCLFAAGMLTSWAFAFVNAATGEIVAIVSLALQFAPLVVTILSIRYDLAKLVIATYEFWYVMAMTSMAASMMLVYIRDWRRLFVATTCVNYLITFTADANISSVKAMVISTLVGCFSLTAFLVYVAFDLVDGVHDVVVFQYQQKRTVSTKDIISNALVTIFVVLVRNAYRRQTSTVSKTRSAVIVRCVSLRTRVALVPVSVDAVTPPSSTRPRHSPSACHDATGLTTQLELASETATYDSRQVLFTRFEIQQPSHPVLRVVWFIFPWLGLILTAMGLSFRPEDKRFSIASVVATLLYCLPCYAQHSTQLLRRLVTSFDYLFLESQMLFANLTMCHLYHWDIRCLPIVSLTLWMHWVVTLDALMPVAKKRLGINMRVAAAVLIVQGLNQLVLVFKFVFGSLKEMDDRVLLHLSLTTTRADTFRINAIPFLFGRAFTILLWCLRLLWRLRQQKENELIMVQGVVQYHDYELQKRLRGSRKRGVAPVRRSIFRHGKAIAPQRAAG